MKSAGSSCQHVASKFRWKRLGETATETETQLSPNCSQPNVRFGWEAKFERIFFKPRGMFHKI